MQTRPYSSKTTARLRAQHGLKKGRTHGNVSRHVNVDAAYPILASRSPQREPRKPARYVSGKKKKPSTRNGRTKENAVSSEKGGKIEERKYKKASNRPPLPSCRTR
jgi:hypothetical protein